MSKIKVIVKEPYQEARVEEIEYNIGKLQETVRGILNYIPFPSLEEDVDLIINDDSRVFDTFDKNILAPNHENGFIAGVIVACSFDKTGKAKNLSDGQIEKIKAFLEENHIEQKQVAEM